MRGGIGAATLATLAGGAVPAALSSASVVLTADAVLAKQASNASQTIVTRDGFLMHPGYAKSIAQLAYVWGWPMVNVINRRAEITQAPQPGHLNGVLPAAPRGQIAMLHDYIEPSETFVTCPNQDVVYGLGFFSLDEEPVWCRCRISATDSGSMRCTMPGLTSSVAWQAVKSKPGFYLLVGPRWKGLKPAGVMDVFRCSTSLANAIPRVFQDDTPTTRRRSSR